MIQVSSGLVNPESPPLTAYLEALQLFVDAFRPAGGFRLLRIARPALLFYGLYGTNGVDPGEDRLAQITQLRGTLASSLDCLHHANLSLSDAKLQAAFDRILYDLDRAIDLYAVGSASRPAPEQRAAAYAYVIEATERRFGASIDLSELVALLRPASLGLDAQLMFDELAVRSKTEEHWVDLVHQLGPRCIDPGQVLDELEAIFESARGKIAESTPVDSAPRLIGIPAHGETSRAGHIFGRDLNGNQP